MEKSHTAGSRAGPLTSILAKEAECFPNLSWVLFFFLSFRDATSCVFSEFRFLLWIHPDCRKNSYLYSWKHLSKLSPFLRSPLLIHQVSCDLILRIITFSDCLQKVTKFTCLWLRCLEWDELGYLMRFCVHLQRFGLQWHLGLWHKKRLMIIIAITEHQSRVEVTNHSYKVRVSWDTLLVVYFIY